MIAMLAPVDSGTVARILDEAAGIALAVIVLLAVLTAWPRRRPR